MFSFAPRGENPTVFDTASQGNVAVTLALLDKVSSPEELKSASLQAVKGALFGVTHVKENDSYLHIIESVYARRVLSLTEITALIVQSNNHALVYWLLDKGMMAAAVVAEVLCLENKLDFLSEIIEKKETEFFSFAYGVAAAGNMPLLKQLIACGANRNHALVGALKGASLETINYLSSLGATLDNSYLNHVVSFSYSSVKKELDTHPLFFLSHINDEKLRAGLVSVLTEKNQEFDSCSFLTKAAVINVLIRQVGMTFEQAQEFREIAEDQGWNDQVLMEKAGKVLTLVKENDLTISQGVGYLTLGATLMLFQRQICLENKLPIELHDYALSFLTQLPWKEHEKIHEAAVARLARRCAHLKNSIFYQEKEGVVDVEGGPPIRPATSIP